MQETVIYPGTFDPITNGHIDLVRRISSDFSEVIIAVANITDKKTLFSFSERLALTQSVINIEFNNNFNNFKIKVIGFDGLLTEFARQQGVRKIIRGLRTVQDFEAEAHLSQLNRHLAPEIESYFLVAKPEYQFISSSKLREIATAGCSIAQFVPEIVSQALINKIYYHKNNGKKKS